MPQTNWLAILIASLIPLVVGFIYYHKNVFGNAWKNSLGLTDDDLRKGNMVIIFGVSLFMSFLISMFLLVYIDGPGQEGQYDTFKHGAAHGVLLSLFVAMPVLVTNGLFERKNFKNLAINTLYWVITMALMGGTIDAMNHWPADMPPM